MNFLRTFDTFERTFMILISSIDGIVVDVFLCCKMIIVAWYYWIKSGI